MWRQRAPQLVQWSRTHLPLQETQETLVQALGQEDPLKEDMATCSISLPGKPMDRGARQTPAMGSQSQMGDGPRLGAAGRWGDPRGRVFVPVSRSMGSWLLPSGPGSWFLCKDGDSPGLPREPRVPCEDVSLRPSMKQRVAATRHPDHGFGWNQPELPVATSVLLLLCL